MANPEKVQEEAGGRAAAVAAFLFGPGHHLVFFVMLYPSPGTP